MVAQIEAHSEEMLVVYFLLKRSEKRLLVEGEVLIDYMSILVVSDG